jgi:hypothetical protein
MNDPSITIQTSRGMVLQIRVRELSDRQLAILIAENADAEPTDMADHATTRPELIPISTNTHRDLAWKRLVDVIYQSIGGSPWTDEFEDALTIFKQKFDAAIDAVPDVAEVFDKPLTRDASGRDGIDTIAPLPF